MRDDNCTGQATSANPVLTAKKAAFRWPGYGGSRAAGDGLVHRFEAPAQMAMVDP